MDEGKAGEQESLGDVVNLLLPEMPIRLTHWLARVHNVL